MKQAFYHLSTQDRLSDIFSGYNEAIETSLSMGVILTLVLAGPVAGIIIYSKSRHIENLFMPTIIGSVASMGYVLIAIDIVDASHTQALDETVPEYIAKEYDMTDVHITEIVELNLTEQHYIAQVRGVTEGENQEFTVQYDAEQEAMLPLYAAGDDDIAPREGSNVAALLHSVE